MSPATSTAGRPIERLCLVSVGFLAALGPLSLLKGSPVQAQAPGVNLTALNSQVQALAATVTSRASQINSLKSAVSTLESTVTTQATAITSLQSTVSSQATTITSLSAGLVAVQAKTQYMTVDPVAQSTTFSGCNVFVNDGGGSTSDLVTNTAGDGLGNLIVGYNKPGNRNGDNRTGSHNLIVGDENNYSSYGGLVAGEDNAISAAYASVSGGLLNTASGDFSSVSGGFQNIASGLGSSVSGGGSGTSGGGLNESDTVGWSAGGPGPVGTYHSP